MMGVIGIGSRETANVYRWWSRAARTRLHRARHSECLESCSAGVEVAQNLATKDENREHGEIHVNALWTKNLSPSVFSCLDIEGRR